MFDNSILMLNVVKQKTAKKLAPFLDTSASDIAEAFEIPKKLSHGNLALPVFKWAKARKTSPQSLAKDLACKMDSFEWVESVSVVGGFVNVLLNFECVKELFASSFKAHINKGDVLGSGSQGEKHTMAIDFSSPNVAKPMHVGHLRASVVGQALYNLAKAQSYKVIGINHLGDWGVLFGRLIWAYEEWGTEYNFESDAFISLHKLYIRFHQEMEARPELSDLGSQVFQKLEAGDEKLLKLWKRFVSISLKEYSKVWKQLNIKHDLVLGESFYNDKLKAVEKHLEEMSLLEESDGAMVVRLDEINLPPCLIRKTDGASLYATRDLASAFYRNNSLKADLNLYVVGQDQKLYFRQIFKVLEKMKQPWVKGCHHIDFGMYLFKDSKMSSRKGHVVLLEDVLKEGHERVLKIIEEKNPTWSQEQKERVSKDVSVGAIVFNDLLNDRKKDIEFYWDKILDFEGHSGPYVQYALVRCFQLIKKFKEKHKKEIDAQFDMNFFEKNFSFIDNQVAQELVQTLLIYDHVLSKSFLHFKPSTLANYLVQVSSFFSAFYHNEKILNSHKEKELICLVYLTKEILEQGLKILNVPCPSEM